MAQGSLLSAESGSPDLVIEMNDSATLAYTETKTAAPSVPPTRIQRQGTVFVPLRAALTRAAVMAGGGAPIMEMEQDIKSAHDDVVATGDQLVQQDPLLLAHLPVLAARSEYFQAFAQSEWRDAKEKRLRIRYYSREVVERVLRYMYCGQLDGLSHENVADVYLAAGEYLLEEAKDECLHALGLMKVDDLLQVARRRSAWLARDLFERVLVLLRRNGAATLNSPVFSLLPDSVKAELTKESMVGVGTEDEQKQAAALLLLGTPMLRM